MNGWLGISLGDVTGIGPEVALKAVAAEAANDDTKYLFIGDENTLTRLNRKLSLNLPLKKFSSYRRLPGNFSSRIRLQKKLPENLPAGSPIAAQAAIAYLRDGAERCLRGELDALITAPVNKEAIIRAGHKFVGQTEFLSELAGAKRTAMMLLGHDEKNRWLRVALATVHIRIKIGSQKTDGGKNFAGGRTRCSSLPRFAIAARKNRRRRFESARGRRRGIWRRGNQNHCADRSCRAETWL